MNFIVSLTSYGARINTTLPVTLKSLNNCNNFKPSKIIVYIAHDDKKLINEKLFRQFDNVEFRFVDDFKSHKKFFSLTDRSLDGEFIVIVDDDLNYKTYFFEKLFAKYDQHKGDSDNFIVCNRAQLISGKQYRRTPFILKDDADCGKFRFGSGSGLLIPPHVMRFEVDTLAKGFELSPHCDETFYSCNCVANNIVTYTTGLPQPFYMTPLPTADPSGLWTKYNQYEKDEIMIKMKKYFNMIDDNIFVSFTSWTKRIQFASHVVEMMRKQTLKPYKIILTLSTDEFPNKLKDLPSDLVAMQGEDFEIRWVKENSKTFKKCEPLFYINKEHWVLLVDDDVNYPENFIETMVASVRDGNPVTGSHLKTDYRQHGNILSANGAFTLIKPLHCLPYLKQMKEFAFERGFLSLCSDPALTYAVMMNGYKFTPSIKNYFQLQKNGKKLPEPYSSGKIGIERNKQSHEVLQEYLKGEK